MATCSVPDWQCVDNENFCLKGHALNCAGEPDSVCDNAYSKLHPGESPCVFPTDTFGCNPKTGTCDKSIGLTTFKECSTTCKCTNPPCHLPSSNSTNGTSPSVVPVAPAAGHHGLTGGDDAGIVIGLLALLLLLLGLLLFAYRRKKEKEKEDIDGYMEMVDRPSMTEPAAAAIAIDVLPLAAEEPAAVAADEPLPLETPPVSVPPTRNSSKLESAEIDLMTPPVSVPPSRASSHLNPPDEESEVPPPVVRNRKFSAVDVHGRNIHAEAQAVALARLNGGRKASWQPARKASAVAVAGGNRAVDFTVAEQSGDVGHAMKREQGSRQMSDDELRKIHELNPM